MLRKVAVLCVSTAVRTCCRSPGLHIEPDAHPDAPAGSLLITYVDEARIKALVEAGWRKVLLNLDADNRPAAIVLRKLG